MKASTFGHKCVFVYTFFYTNVMNWYLI